MAIFAIRLDKTNHPPVRDRETFTPIAATVRANMAKKGAPFSQTPLAVARPTAILTICLLSQVPGHPRPSSVHGHDGLLLHVPSATHLHTAQHAQIRPSR